MSSCTSGAPWTSVDGPADHAIVGDRIEAGTFLFAALVAGGDVTVEVSMADYDAWFQAAKKWFIDGAHDEKDEMSGAIVFLAPDLKTEIGRVTLKNCGFAKFTRGAFEANSEAVARFSCEFYVENMELAIN